MKKSLFIMIITALMLVSVVLLTPKRANAEETQEITPFYGGDILNGKDLYLFEQYTTTPNFENGYISKKTISSQDVFYQDNGVLTQFNGWYKDLGMDLIDSYVESFPSATDFVFYIPMFGMLSRYFQLAMWVDSTYNAYHYIKYVGENPIRILSVEDINKYLLMADVGNKIIEWYAYEVKYPDYLPSFRPLTAQLAYQFGFDSGETEGFNRGYNSGFNIGHSTGYQQGLTDSAVEGYYQVFDFNQLIKNGNFTDNTEWTTYYNLDFSVSENKGTLTPVNQFSSLRSNTIDFKENHKYYLTFNYINNATALGTWTFYILSETDYIQTPYYIPLSLTTNKVETIITPNETTTKGIILQYNNSNVIQSQTLILSNVMVIDLTQMFGEGNEPDITTCEDIFKASYYDYNTSTLLSLNYLDGYNEGLGVGYNRGSNAQATKQLTATGWIQSIFAGLGSLLGLQIFPGVTIGLIVGIPFVISLAYFVIRAFRGGGGA